MRAEPDEAPQARPEKVRWTEPAPEPGGDDLRAERIEPEQRQAPADAGGGKRRRKRKADPDLLGADAGRGKSKSKAKRRRAIFSIILVVSLVIAFVGIGVLWVVFNGLLQSPDQRDARIPNPPATVDGGGLCRQSPVGRFRFPATG